MISGLPTKLKELRLALGYSQREVAKQLNLSPSIVSSYETGERTPSVDVLLSLSYLYRCSNDYLLGKTANAPVSSLPVDGLLPKQVQLVRDIINEFKESNLHKHGRNSRI